MVIFLVNLTIYCKAISEFSSCKFTTFLREDLHFFIVNLRFNVGNSWFSLRILPSSPGEGVFVWKGS